MDDKISKDELLEVMLAPARRTPERSLALPESAYRDPAQTVQLQAEKAAPPRPRRKALKPNKKWR